LYWSAGDYAGFGAGAHGHFSGRRYWRTRLPRAYVAALEQGRSTIAGGETLSADARAGEALMLGLRLTQGIDLAGFARRFGTDPLGRREGTLAALVAAGLLERSGERLALAPGATLVANEALSRLL
jgi:oxygen-independent coproporphyrinogen-3 oxidase